MAFTWGKHKVVKKDFTCPMCLHTKRKFAFHVYNPWEAYSSFECEFCHNYIRQCDGDMKVHKEFFYVKDYIVVMNKDSVILEKENCEDIELPFFVFSGDLDLIKKIKTYVLFS